MTITPFVAPEVFKIAPNFKALSITVKESVLKNNPNVALTILKETCKEVLENDFTWAKNHLDEWDEVFKNFGAKPNKTSCSAIALRKRLFKEGYIPSVNPIVDIYNAISIKYAIPVGGENLDAYEGNPTLTVANGTELFDTMKSGNIVNDSPILGEVIWRDNVGVTCRRWNWRQGVRTRIDENTRNMWFILEGLSSIPLESLNEAGNLMVNNLKLIMPNATFSKKLISSGL